MKKLLTTILILITLLGYSRDQCKECPGILLGKSYQAIQNVFKPYDDYFLIVVTDTTLQYYNWREDISKTYTFKWYKGVRRCVGCDYIVDCLTGEELIGKHLSDKSWIPTNDMQWEYGTLAYDIPITVKLKYVDGFMVFSYRYIPKEIR